MSVVLGSSPKKHRAQKRAFVASLGKHIRVFRKELKKARTSKRHCRAAGRALLNVGFASGAAFSEMRGASRKSSLSKRVSGAAHNRAMKALSAFDKVCMAKPAKKKGKK